jgi:2-hydroxychromene-2-carboxylate isomerase
MDDSMDLLIPEEALTICLNFDSLDTYVGLAPILDLARDLLVPVNLLPLVLQQADKRQQAETQNDPLAVYKARRAAARSRYAERELVRNCQQLGIDVAMGARRFDASAGAIGLLWLRSQSASQSALWQFVEAAFLAAYTSDAGLDEETVEHLLAESAQQSASPFSDPAAKQQLHEQLGVLQQTLLDHGIFDSPAFYYQGELMQGRQHLPRLRWLLEGASGPSPT